MPDSPPAERIRLLLADVDGTLVDEEKHLTERAQAAVRRLHEVGIAFAITSGRPPRGMAMLIKPLALEQPLAGFNGGVFARPDLTVISERRLGADPAREAAEAMEAGGLDVWLYTGSDWYVHDTAAPHVAREAWTVKFDARIAADYEALYDQAVKMVGVSDDHDKVAGAEKSTRERLGERATAARSQPYYLDVTHPLANKGAVVETLAKQLGIPLGEVATIGDMPNDMRMFVRSGLAIAMGQASEEVRAAAHKTTASYAAEGFARAVEDFVLPRAPK